MQDRIRVQAPTTEESDRLSNAQMTGWEALDTEAFFAEWGFFDHFRDIVGARSLDSTIFS